MIFYRDVNNKRGQYETATLMSTRYMHKKPNFSFDLSV